MGHAKHTVQELSNSLWGTMGWINRRLYSRERISAKNKAELTYIGAPAEQASGCQLYSFDASHCSVTEGEVNLSPLQEPGKLHHWYNLHGIHDVDRVLALAERAQIDRLSIRQLLDTRQRPKVTYYEQYLLITIKSIVPHVEEGLHIEQITFILQNQVLLTFQEEQADHFEGIRNKITENLGFIRKRTPDYLLSQLLDALLDHYHETIEHLNVQVRGLESQVLHDPNNALLISIERLRQYAVEIRKALRPFREAINKITVDIPELITPDNRKYYADLANGLAGATEEIEGCINSLEGLSNMYFSSLSHKMNETMRLLTLVATIFIPLTFIAGIYGMNFSDMPELQWPYGYYMSLGLMALVGIGMFAYFKYKRWL